jgi:hypothetical protein
MSPITLAALFQLAVLPVDDGELLREARKAQVRFETVRRSHLPWNRFGGSAGHCAVPVGRYCYWYDSTRTRVIPEPAQISAARGKLLTLLDSAARLHPADDWVAGQRVRYLMEADDARGALDAARSCGAERWWCAALEGLALHFGGRFQEADSAFGTALDAMPGQQRCEWTDIRALIRSGADRELSAASCAERETLANRLWELGRPLWSVPGNDLRTEHFARQTMAAALAHAANAHGIPWGDDSRELLVRYGWAEWFTRDRNDIGGMTTTPRVTGHDREPSYHFFPDIPAGRSMPPLTSASWTLLEPAARTRYAPRYLEELSDLPHQLARFPRGDSTLVAVAYRITDSTLARDSQNVYLGYQAAGRDRPVALLQRGGGVMLATIPADPIIASLEVLGRRSKHAARARYTVDARPCASWCLSDVLLLDATDGAAEAALESVIPRAAPVLRFASGTPLGLYWEIQRRAVGERPVRMTITVSPLRPSVARRVAARLKLAPTLTPVRLNWQTTLRADREEQYLTLRLPRNARGRYRVTLTVEPTGTPALTATREIELVP